MFCARCHEQTTGTESCDHCGQPPLLDERYRLEHLLGHGANGTTWRACRVVDGTVCVVKEISVRRLSDFKSLELFEREAEVLKSLDHPAIPDYIDDLVVEDGRHVNIYIVQQFIDGQPLRRVGWTEESLLDLVDEMADLLVYLGERRPPVVHRDIKPSNILCDQERYYLIDFGATAIVRGGVGGNTVAGTFGYMAPEQLRGVATAATDIYGLGATALSLATGRDPAELIEPGKHGTWRERVSLSEPFAALLMRMLHPEPEQRIQAPAQLKFEVERVRQRLAITQQPASAPAAPVAVASSPKRQGRRRRARRRPERHWLNGLTERFINAAGASLVVPFGLYVLTALLLLVLHLLSLLVGGLLSIDPTSFIDGVYSDYLGAKFLFTLVIASFVGVWVLYLIGPTWQALATKAPRWWPRWRRMKRSWFFRTALRECFSWSILGRLFSLALLVPVTAVIWGVCWALEPSLRVAFGYSGPDFLAIARGFSVVATGFWLGAPVLALLFRSQLSWRRVFSPGFQKHWPDRERHKRFVALARHATAPLRSLDKVRENARLRRRLQPHSASQKQDLARLTLLDTRQIHSEEWQGALQVVLSGAPTADRRRLLEEVALRVSSKNAQIASDLFALAHSRDEEL